MSEMEDLAYLTIANELIDQLQAEVAYVKMERDEAMEVVYAAKEWEFLELTCTPVRFGARKKIYDRLLSALQGFGEWEQDL